MKKLFISLVAIAAAVFATSCTNDLVDSVNGYEGKTAKVGIEVSTPELATRTFGDGKSATNLYYGVYDEAGVLLPGISVIDTPAEINIKTTVNLELVTGDTYTIVFWAENAGSAATIDWANKKMTFDPTTASKEEYDAFYGKIDFTVDGPATLKADLVRPFAQVNIGTADYEKAQKAGMTVQDVMVKVKAFDTMDLFTAEATKSDAYECHEYAYAVAPTEAFPVAGYEYMSMNYVLVNEAKHLVDVEMTYRNTENKEYNVVYGNVPVQRNYRTNIYGNLLTDQTGVIVEIKPAFEDDAADVDPYIRPWDGSMEQPAIDGNTVYIATGEQLAFLADAINTDAPFDYAQTRADVTYGNNKDLIVVLTQDIDLNKMAWTPIKQLFGTFDGQGHTIKNLYVNEESDKGSAGLFASARNVKNLTIDGFEVKGHYKAGAITGDGLCSKIENCHVKNGKVISTVSANTKDDANNVGGIVGYLSAEPTAYVKGCSVENVDVTAYRKVGAVVGAANGKAVVEECVVKNVAVTADMTAEYAEVKAPDAGEIVGYASASAKVENNYAEGVKVSVKIPNPKDVDKAADVLAKALTQNAKHINVVLSADVDLPISSLGQITPGSGEYKLGGVDTETITIALNGKKLNITTTYWSNLGAKNANALFTIKNGIMTSSQETGTWNSYDLTFSNCDYVFEDVVFEKAVAFDNAGKEVSMKNVTINETHDYYALWITAAGQTVNVDKLTINSAGRGIKIDEQYVGTPAKVTLNVKDSKIKSVNKAAIMVKSSAGAEINVENLNITEAAADTKFAVWVDEDGAAYDELVTVTGCQKRVEGSTVVAGEIPEEKQKNFAAAVKEGATIYIPAGNYVVPDAAKGKTLTIIGTGNPEDVKIATDNVSGSYEGCNYALDGSTVTFENISINTPSTTYVGYARCNATYKNCVINGTYTLYGDSVFENCTFNVSGDVYNIWTWGAPTATFTECTFNCDGKAMLLYGTANTKLTMNKCVFNDNGGLADLKAAIEIGDDYGKSYELIVNNATVNGFEINDKGINTNTTLWANKNSMPKEKLNVVVDGVDVY